MWISCKCRQGQTKFSTVSAATMQLLAGSMEEHGEQNRYEPEQSQLQLPLSMHADNQRSSNFCGVDKVCFSTTHAKSTLVSHRSSWVAAKGNILQRVLTPFLSLLPPALKPTGIPWVRDRVFCLSLPFSQPHFPHTSPSLRPQVHTPCTPHCASVLNPAGKVLQRSLTNKRSRTPSAPLALLLAAILLPFPAGSYAVSLIMFL